MEQSRDKLDLDKLEVGREYRVIFMVERGMTEIVGGYLGKRFDGYGLFDLRPAAGTASLPASQVVAVYETTAARTGPHVAKGMPEVRVF